MKLQIETPTPSDRRQRPRRSTGSSRRRRAACASARWCATPISRPTRACGATTACCRARCSPAPRASCATRRRPPATCCSARAAPISTTPTSPATSARPAAAARRSAASAGSIAVIGASDACIATHPSDMAVAMRALDATVETVRAGRLRRAASRSPTSTACPATRRRSRPRCEPGELITAVTLPPPVGGTQIYRKVRDRASYAFALVSVAAIVQRGRHRPRRARRRRPQAVARRGGRSRAAARRASAVAARLLAGAQTDRRQRLQAAAGRAHARRGAGRSEGLSHEVRHARHAPIPIDQLQGRRPADRPHRRPAEDHRHARPTPMSATTSRPTRPMATSSARRSPRGGSSSMDLADAQGRARRARHRHGARMPASSARASCNTAKLLGGPEIQHYHQAIALVVAETFEQARAAAQLVRIDYAPRPGAFDLAAATETAQPARQARTAPADTQVGDFDGAFAAAPVQARRDLHHARPGPRDDGAARHDRRLGRRPADALDLEPDDRLGQRATSPRRSACRKDKVRLISPYHRRRLRRQAVPARRCRAGRARRRAAGRPVKVALQRPLIFNNTTHRPRRSSASASAPTATARSPRSATRAGPATCRAASPKARCSQTRAALCRRQPHDRDAAGRARPAGGQRHARARRGAGHDGAGDRHGRDGREARARSGRVPHPQRHAGVPTIPAPRADPQAGNQRPPFSQRQLVECLRIGAERFGWNARNRAAGRRCATDSWLVGMGMAAAFRNNLLMKSAARVRLDRRRASSRSRPT